MRIVSKLRESVYFHQNIIGSAVDIRAHIVVYGCKVQVTFPVQNCMMRNSSGYRHLGFFDCQVFFVFLQSTSCTCSHIGVFKNLQTSFLSEHNRSMLLGSIKHEAAQNGIHLSSLSTRSHYCWARPSMGLHKA